MNYYDFSKRIDVFDSQESKLYKEIVGSCTPTYYRYYAGRWLAWYRVFYKLGDVAARKTQLGYFIDEIQHLHH